MIHAETMTGYVMQVYKIEGEDTYKVDFQTEYGFKTMIVVEPSLMLDLSTSMHSNRETTVYVTGNIIHYIA